MTRMTMLHPSHADALREAAASASPEIVLRIHGLQNTYFWPHRTRLRVGQPPVRDIAHMHFVDLVASNAVSVIYVRRERTCRACGQPIQTSERVVKFGIRPSLFAPFGRPAFLHEVCP